MIDERETALSNLPEGSIIKGFDGNCMCLCIKAGYLDSTWWEITGLDRPMRDIELAAYLAEATLLTDQNEEILF